MNILFFMTPKCDVAFVEEEDSLRNTLEKMEFHRYSSIPVLRKHFEAVGINSSMESLIHRAVNQNFVPVVDDLNHFIGIVKRREIMNYLYRHANFKQLDKEQLIPIPLEESAIGG